MKTVLMIIILAASTVAFANTPPSRTAQRSEASSNTPLKNIFSTNQIAGSAKADVHFMTNVAGLFNGETNVQANFFGMPQLALSVSFTQSSEKTDVLKKASWDLAQNPKPKATITETEFGIGAAYYVWPVSHKLNVMLNPYLVSNRRTDPVDVDNTTGLGLKADGMIRFSEFAFNLGAQYSSATAGNATSVNAAIGYLF